MNLFTSLDLLFPTTPNRASGEIVSVQMQVGNLFIADKRKAWYVNTSVNAFHMHRSLIRQFHEGVNRTSCELSFADEKQIKRLIVLCVLNAYLANHQTGLQYQEYSIVAPVNHFPERDEWSAWWVMGALDWREVGDWTGLSLKDVIDLACLRLSKAARTMENPLES